MHETKPVQISRIRIVTTRVQKMVKEKDNVCEDTNTCKVQIT